MSSVFFNKGENCIAAGRLFVEESIHDQFIAKVLEETKKMIIGDPLNRSTAHGPQNHKAHLDKLLEVCKLNKLLSFSEISVIKTIFILILRTVL